MNASEGGDSDDIVSMVGINGDIAEFEGKGNGEPIDAFVRFNQHSSLHFRWNPTANTISTIPTHARLRTSTFSQSSGRSAFRSELIESALPPIKAILAR